MRAIYYQPMKIDSSSSEGQKTSTHVVDSSIATAKFARFPCQYQSLLEASAKPKCVGMRVSIVHFKPVLAGNSQILEVAVNSASKRRAERNRSRPHLYSDRKNAPGRTISPGSSSTASYRNFKYEGPPLLRTPKSAKSSDMFDVATNMIFSKNPDDNI